MQTPAVSFEPRRALRALRALVRNPDDTAQVFTVIESLSGHAPARLMERFRTSERGARLLRERPNIVSILADRDRLRAMPEGSLAHAYLRFVENEGISADGLVSASDEGRSRVRGGPEFEWVSDRLRDTHDLWHSVTGYQGDVIGEAALLAFSLAQTHNPGVGVIVLAGLAQIRDAASLRTILRGFARGVRAEWLPTVEWESLLPLPVAEVRKRLGIDAPPVYMAVRTNELRAMGFLQPRAA